jgi:hypothetical protein
MPITKKVYPFTSVNDVKQVYDKAFKALETLSDKKDKLEEDFKKYIKQRYDQYSVEGNDLCQGIRKVYIIWLSQWQTFIWYLHAYRFGDTHKLVLDEAYKYERTSKEVCRIDGIQERNKADIKNAYFCAFSVEGLDHWAKIIKAKTDEEKNYRDILIDSLKGQFDSLVKESATMITTLLNEAKTDSNGYSKTRRYTLHFECEKMQVYSPSFRIQLKFTSLALETTKIVTFLSPKTTCSDTFLEKPVNKRRNIATSDNEDSDKNDSSKENLPNGSNSIKNNSGLKVRSPNLKERVDGKSSDTSNFKESVGEKTSDTYQVK